MDIGGTMMGSSDQFMEINELHTVYTDPTKFDLISDDIIRFYICVFFWENNGINITHDGSMVRLYINANIKGFLLMESMLPYIAAPWILWVMGQAMDFISHINPPVSTDPTMQKVKKKSIFFTCLIFFRYSL